jgi:hypothetical protein
MTEIPAYFIEKARRQFGTAGPAWVEGLPSLLARCIERWDLRDCQPIENLSINLVCLAHSPTFGRWCRKSGPHRAFDRNDGPGALR